MRFSMITFGVLLCVSVPALADANEGALRQKLFEMDKAVALADFDVAQQQACMKAFDLRYQAQYTLSEGLAFNEPLSLGAYDRLFWKGEGKVPRGLIFTGIVTDKAGAKAGSLVCYYATTDDRLDFQSAYVLPKEVTVAYRETVQASLITASSRE